MFETRKEPGRRIASRILKDLFGEQYFQHNKDRLLERFAEITGDRSILEPDPAGDMLDSMFGFGF